MIINSNALTLQNRYRELNGTVFDLLYIESINETSQETPWRSVVAFSTSENGYENPEII